MLVQLVNQELDIFKTFVTGVFKAVNVIPDFLLPWVITTSLVSILIMHRCETSFVKERRFIPGCSNHDWLLRSNFYNRWSTSKTRLKRSIDLTILPILFVVLKIFQGLSFLRFHSSKFVRLSAALLDTKSRFTRRNKRGDDLHRSDGMQISRFNRLRSNELRYKE